MTDRNDAAGPPGDVPRDARGADGPDVTGAGGPDREGHPEAPVEARVREQEAEARLREFAAMHDSMASFAGPDDEHGRPHGAEGRRRGRRRQPPDQTSDLGYGYEYDEHEGGTPIWRWVVSIVAPLAFIGVVVALVLVVMNSGILDGGGAAVSPSPTVSPSDPAVVGERTYKVKKNDTLSQIAERFGTTVDKVLEANPKINLNNLRVGQKLTIPPPD